MSAIAFSSHRSPLSLRLFTVLTFAYSVFIPQIAVALPSGGQVVAGDISISSAGGRMDITQIGRAGIINWADFGIGAREVVNIHQAADAALLNRVMGANPSELLGQLNASGHVFLINPNGIIVGRDASINTMQFVASALDVADAEFLRGGPMTFQGDSTAGVINLGTITAANGDAILIAHRVVNAGEISSPNGVTALAAGNEVLLSPESDQRILVKTTVPEGALDADGGGTGVENSGVINAVQAELQASGGNVYGLAVNQAGFIRATGVEHKNGRVLLTSDGGQIAHSGTIAARNADGSGGEVLVGGDFRGQNAAVANAKSTSVTADAVIDVSADSDRADAGRVIVWADEQTDFAGTILGQGGNLGGDGAFAEVSGKRILNYTGLADLTASFGATGTLWLDPEEAIISAATDDPANGFFNNIVLSDNLATANVVVDASGFGDGIGFKIGEIFVNAPVTWASGNTLTLKAGNSITVNADLSGAGGDIVFEAMGISLGDSIMVDTGATITANTLTIGQNHDAEFFGFNPLPAQSRSLNGITIEGILNVGTLDIKTENAGIDGGITITNFGNTIGKLTSTTTSGTIAGDIEIINGTGGLIVDGDFSNIVERTFNASPNPDITVQHGTSIVTTGDLTLAAGTRLASTTGRNVILAAEGGAFTNNAGIDAIALGTGGRSLIYSSGPDATTLGGLLATPVYNKTFAANAPGTITQAGNRILYSLAPTITFTAANLDRLYGGTNPALTFSMAGLVGGDTAGEAFTGSPGLSTLATAASDAGNYAISIAPNTVLASDYNYQIAFAPGTLTVNPAPLTITADNKVKAEGESNPLLTASFSGLVNGNSPIDISGLLLATAADINSPPGGYSITASGASSINYDISFVDGILNVTGIPSLLITANSFNIRYGAVLPTFTAAISGFGSGDDESIVSGLTLTSAAMFGSPVGSYSIVPSGASASGYEIDYVNGMLTIDPALLTITASSLNRFYGAANPFLGVSFDGFVHGEDASVVSDLTVSTPASEATGIGDYQITASGATAPNYDISFAPGTLSIARAPLSIDVTSFTKLFGDLNPALTATTNGLVLGQSLADLGTFTLATTATQFTDVGDLSITASLTGALANNYATTINPGTLSIVPRPVTVRIGGGTREYGEANPTITRALIGDAPVGTSNFFVNNVTLGSTITDATPASDVGLYPTTISDMTAANPNFDITVEEGTITVIPAPLNIRANNASRLYGAVNPTFSATTTGLKLSDTLAEVLAGPSFATSATSTSNVGNYAIMPSGTALTGNYAVTFTPGTLAVNKAPLFVAPTLASRLYGDPDPAFTISATGLLNGDTAAVVRQATFSGSALFAGVGSQPISILGATATNYSLSFGTGTINILPRPLTITANNFTREYGEANPVFTFSFSNLASFDSPAAISGVAVSNPPAASSSVFAGGYALNPTSGINPNYTISYAPGFLDITPAPLLVQLGNVSREYGDANPVPSVNIATGLKLDDTLATLGLQISTPAVVTSDVGNYPYDTTSTNPNYSLTVTGGILSVTPASLFVNLDDVFRRYGDENPTSYTGNLSGLKFAASLDSIVLVTDPTFVDTHVGTYNLGALSLTDNYRIEGVSGQVRVAPRPLNLSFTDLSRLYGEAEPSQAIFLNALALDGVFAAGDQPLDVIRISSAANTRSNVGNYPLQVAVLNPNYLGSPSVSGQLAVTPRPLDVGLRLIERVYGQDNPTNFNSFRVTGFPNDLLPFDSFDSVLAITAPAPSADIGVYSLSASLISPNYTLQSFSGLMDITRRPISLRLPDGVRRIYGEANPVIPAPLVLNPSESATTGVAPFDTIEDVIEYNLPDITAPAGFYTLGATVNNNYEASIQNNDSRIFVDPRPIRIALDSFSRIYAESNPSMADLLTVLDFFTPPPVSGLASFDSVEDLLTLSPPGEQQGVGTYSIFDGGTNPNYNISIASGRDATATITPRSLSVFVNPFTRFYGDENPQIGVNFLGRLDAPVGLASFDTEADVLTRTLPSIEAEVGTYSLIQSTENPNYDYGLFFGEGTIAPRPLQVTLPGFIRTYGEENPADAIFAVNGTLAPFHVQHEVIRINSPEATTGAGVYPVVDFLNPNYAFDLSGSADYTIEQRILNFDNIYRTYGDDSLIFSALGGNGPASFDSLETLIRPVLHGEFSHSERGLASGYYAITDFGLTDSLNYRIASNPSQIFTVLPRALTITIQDFNRTFETPQEVRDFLGNENQVIIRADASAQNLVAGDIFDDAFPIIRYQIVGVDAVPPLSLLPTIDNILFPAAEELINGTVRSGSGVVLNELSRSRGTSDVPRVQSGALTTAGVVIDGFVTVFDDFDTEQNYVLRGVTNGKSRIILKPAVIQNANETITTGFNFTLTPTPVFPTQGPLTIVSAANPPSILEFFNSGHQDLALDMIQSYLNRTLLPGMNYDFEPGSLLAEITRSTSGTLDDITPFRIQRWLERNAGNPASMELIGEALADYAKDFLEKDPATYTESEAAFSGVLSLHLTKARDDFAERVEARRDEWIAQEVAKGSNMADLFGRDMPYKDFFEEGAMEYVSDALEANIAAGVAAGGGSVAVGVAAGFGMKGAIGVIAPYALLAAQKAAFAIAVKAGATTAGANAAAAGATLSVPILPVAIVATAIVGSVVRGIQVFENERQADIYDSLVGSVGSSVTPSQLSLTTDGGKDDVINQTILLGALSTLLTP